MSLYRHERHPHQPRNVNDVHAQERQGLNARIAVAITKGFGSMTALYILIIWMFGWMILSGLGVWLFARDSFPYPFLLFCSNLVQLWALPAIMVGGNVLNRKTELQADEDFRINQKSLHDNEQIMNHLDAQDEKILAILQRLDVQGGTPTGGNEIKQLTDLVEQELGRRVRQQGYVNVDGVWTVGQGSTGQEK